MKIKNYLYFLIFFLITGSIIMALPPDDKIWDIAIAPRFVWFAYSNGENRAGYPLVGALRRYDRFTQTWRTFTISEIFGIDFPCSITAVATDGNSTVWVGVEPFTGETINFACAYSHNNGDKWTTLSESNGIAVNCVDCIEVDPVTKTVWLGHQWGEAYESISRSTDGGATWTKLSPNYYYGVTAIQAYNNLVWAAADHSVTMVIMKSTDNGEHWTNYDYSNSPALYGDPEDLCMVSPNEVHISLYNYTSVYNQTAGYCYTQDGGTTWYTHQVQKYNEYCKTVAVANGTVWIGQRWDPPDVVYSSNNYGSSWRAFSTSTGLPYDDPFVIRYDEYSDIVWVGFWAETFTNFQGGWCWTDNGGDTWHTDNPPILIISGVLDTNWEVFE